MNTPREVALATALSDVLEPVFARLGRVAAAFAEIADGNGRAWVESELMPAQDVILSAIAEDDLQVGLGFVAVPLAVAGQDRFMMWWQRNEGRVSRLKLNFDQSSIDVYDYVEMEWFRLPASGRPRVTMGPYVDYSGSELYIVTASVPVMVEGRFVGIAGADLLFGELESRLVAVLRRATSEAMVVSAERRVIVANTPRWVLGSRLREIPRAGAEIDGAVITAVESLPAGNGWLLCLADAESN